MTLQGKHIFLLEDDPVNFSVISNILRKNGATVTLDHWGDTSLQKLESSYKNYDLILLDLMLSGSISGYDIFDSIRANSTFDNIPIVAVSASDPDVAIPKTREMGFTGYISKPINRLRFPEQLALVLNGESVWE